MTEAAPAALPLARRAARVHARAGAFVLDTLLVAYAAFCVDFLLAHAPGDRLETGWIASSEGPLGARPWLYLLAPLVAAWWQATGESLGQRGWRVLVCEADGTAATTPRRAWRGLLAGFQVLVALLPAALGVEQAVRGRPASLHLLLSLAMAATFALAGLLDGQGRGLVDRAAGTLTRGRARGADGPLAPWWRRPRAWVVLALLVLTLLVGGRITEVSLGQLATGAGRTEMLWSRLLHPDLSIAGRVAETMVQTVFLALLASVLALPFAFLLGFLGARTVMDRAPLGRLAYVMARVLMNVTRSIEPIVWAIIFTLWVGVGPFAGMLALLVHSVAALGKLYSEAVEAIDPGPVEAIEATGARRLQVLRYGVVPQVVPAFLSFTVYRWDINVRMATILGLVGGGGIGDLLINYQQLGAWAKVGTILLFITIVVWLMDWLSSKARQRLT